MQIADHCPFLLPDAFVFGSLNPYRTIDQTRFSTYFSGELHNTTGKFRSFILLLLHKMK